MIIKKHCPNCGSQLEDGSEFCSECGYDLVNSFQRNEINDSLGFFDKLSKKANIPVLIFSFVIFGIFLFVGSIVWSSFMANGSIDFLTYILLTIVFSVFFGGIFVGYFSCVDKSYVLPNFSIYLGSIFAVVLCGIGLIFTFLMGIISALSSLFSSFGSTSPYANTSQPTTSSFMPSIDFSGVFKIILFILLIPVAAYFGVYLGYFLKENI